MDIKAFKEMTTRTQEQRFIEIRDKIKRGDYPALCGFGLYANQIEEIRNLLLPFTPKNKDYFDNIIRTRLIPG